MKSLFTSTTGAMGSAFTSSVTALQEDGPARYWASALITLVVLYGLKVGIDRMLKTVDFQTHLSSIWVDGKPNEWVLLMNNGEMKKAAVGYRGFKLPFDQVATFPSKLHQAHFETEQITQEMAGVRVSGMLVWGINRIGDGPFKAYKNLEDISSETPTAAND